MSEIIVDSFAGGGGASTGIEMALGVLWTSPGNQLAASPCPYFRILALERIEAKISSNFWWQHKDYRAGAVFENVRKSGTKTRGKNAKRPEFLDYLTYILTVEVVLFEHAGNLSASNLSRPGNMQRLAVLSSAQMLPQSSQFVDAFATLKMYHRTDYVTQAVNADLVREVLIEQQLRVSPDLVHFLRDVVKDYQKVRISFNFGRIIDFFLNGYLLVDQPPCHDSSAKRCCRAKERASESEPVANIKWAFGFDDRKPGGEQESQRSSQNDKSDCTEPVVAILHWEKMPPFGPAVERVA